MPLLARILDRPADPFALAQALAECRHTVLLWLGDAERAYLACDPVAESNALDPEPNLALGGIGGALAAVPRWIGVLPYESCRDLERSGRQREELRPSPHATRPRWLRYSAVAEVHVGRGVRIVGESVAAVQELADRLGRIPRPGEVRLSFLEPPEPAERHMERIHRALARIAAGDLYQVNLARRFRFDAHGAPWDLLRAFSRRGILPFSAALDLPDYAVVAASPELFLSLSPSREVLTEPIKGTRPRSPAPDLDAQLAEDLECDPKERAELAMVLDVERNDLGRIAATGSVRVVRAPHVVSHPTVHHRVATLSAELRPSATRLDLLKSMLPSGSVTGAPKASAMKLIAELEAHRRGLYTGAFGAVLHNGGLCLGMAIRTLTIRESEAHYFAGGGIVADSNPAAEVAETLWKAQHVLECTTSQQGAHKLA